MVAVFGFDGGEIIGQRKIVAVHIGAAGLQIPGAPVRAGVGVGGEGVAGTDAYAGIALQEFFRPARDQVNGAAHGVGAVQDGSESLETTISERSKVVNRPRSG